MRFPLSDPDLLDRALEDHPLPTLLVDAELRVRRANAAARALLDPAPGRLPGVALRGLGEATAPGGCGPGGRCGHCLVRRVVKSALGGIAARERAVLAQGGRGAPRVHLVATAVPLDRAGTSEALLVVEDLSDVLPLPAVLPVCAGCAKIRDDAGAWLQLGAYLDGRLGVEVSHGLCDECMRRLYPDGEG